MPGTLGTIFEARPVGNDAPPPNLSREQGKTENVMIEKPTVSQVDKKLATETPSVITPTPIENKIQTETKKEESFQVATTNSSQTVTSAPVQSADSIVQSALQTTVQIPPSSFCYAEIGAFYNVGWKYQGIREGAGINPVVGFSYLNMVSRKTALSVGLYFTTINQLQLATKTFAVTRVSFGEESNVTVITPTAAKYLVVPFKASYFLNQNNILTAGYSVGYLLDVQSKVQTYTEVNGVAGAKSVSSTGGYTQGFGAFNSQLSVGYRRKIFKGCWVNGEIIYGLSDLRDNSFFGMNTWEQSSGIKISLTYDILKK